MKKIITTWAASQRTHQTALESPAVRELVSRYVPGRSLAEILPVLVDLRRKGLCYSLEYLAEDRVESWAQARHNASSYAEVIDLLRLTGLAPSTELSIRFAAFGTLLGSGNAERAWASIREICRAATNAGVKVTVGMGGSAEIDPILDGWSGLQEDFPDLGITVQAQMLRTAADLPHLAEKRARIRLVKGALSASGKLAYRRAHDIDLAYVRALRFLMESEATVLVGTHDPRVVAIAEALITRNGRGREDHEFQMMYGVRPLEQRRLVDIGHISRVYIPFGPGGFGHYLPRLVERPSTAALFLRSLVGKR